MNGLLLLAEMTQNEVAEVIMMVLLFLWLVGAFSKD